MWHLEVKTNRRIPARKPDLVTINKEKRVPYQVDFTFSQNHRVKTEESK